MTFFLPEKPLNRPLNPLVPEDVPTGLEGLAAGTSKAMIEGDANFKAWNTRRNVTAGVGETAAERVGIEALNQRYERDGPGFDHLRPPPKTVDEFRAMLGDEADRIALELGREQADLHPDQWKDVDLTDAGIEKQTNERLQAEYEDAQKTLDMMPGGAGLAEFAGGLIGSVADVRNVPWLLAGGGGGSFLRVMGREAGLNMAAEGTQLPSRFDMAERLDIPDPSIVGTLAEAAVAGAALGGLFEGLGRAIRYAQGRKVAPRIPGFDAETSEMIVNAAESALARGADPLGAVREAMRAAPPENPLNPGREPLVLRDDQRVRDPVEPNAEEQEILAQLTADVGAKEKISGNRKQPIITALRRSKLGSGATKGKTGTLQIDPDGVVAQELRAQDITPKTAPGLFSRKHGQKEFDNLPASEWEAEFPGIIEATGTAPGANYLDQQGFINLIIRDHAGDTAWLRPAADLAAARKALQEAERTLEEGRRLVGPLKAFAAKDRAPGGFFVDPEAYGFTHGYSAPDKIAADFDRWLSEEWPNANLTPAERGEVLAELTDSGGDAEYLVERVFERDLDFAEADPGSLPDVPFDDVSGPRGEGLGGPDSDPFATGGGREGEGSGPRTEATGAGEQFVAPGVAPITQRQRLESRQNAPLRGGDRPADDGLFDLGSRQQADMFSDPASKEARVIQDSIAEDIRDAVTPKGDMPAREPDFAVEVEIPGGGVRTMKASEVLDWLDEGDKASARMDLCGKMGGGG